MTEPSEQYPVQRRNSPEPADGTQDAEFHDADGILKSRTSLIPVRNKREALDLSLALISQGVESVIEQHGEAWSLRVRLDEEPLATRTIRLFYRENSVWSGSWKHFLPPFGFDWSVLGWVGLMAFLFALSQIVNSRLLSAGALTGSVVAQGAWWRIFTSITLHWDLRHLVSNLSLGVVLLGLAMGRFGPGPALLSAFLAGAGGNLAGLLIHQPPFQAAGSSGMVMGGLGLLAAQSFFPLHQPPAAARQRMAAALAGLMLFVLFALDPSSDVVAHAGGFGFGMLFGSLMTAVRVDALQSRRVNALCLGVLLGIFLLAWSLALRN